MFAVANLSIICCIKFHSLRKKESVQLSLLADFVANRLSAAGVSHVVKSPSPFRRAFWFVIIVLTAIGMFVMTSRVLKEYLDYPSIMRSQSLVMKELEFPAVTICSLSLIPKMFAIEAGLQYLGNLTQLLDSLPIYNVSDAEKIRCLKDPLCAWSWFDDDCYCESSICDTLYCYPDMNRTDEYCVCSMLLCDWNGTTEGCFKFKSNDGDIMCICRDSFKYSLHKERWQLPPLVDCDPDEDCFPYVKKNLPPDFKAALELLNTTPEISDLITKLKLSRSDDAKDVERFFRPSLSVVDDYGVPFDNLVLSCSYGPESCELDFITLYSPLYGKCYMFNYIGKGSHKNKTVRLARQPGKSHGLQLYMQARKEDSIPLLTKELGVRIIVHDPRSIPTMLEESIDIKPGEMLSLSIEYEEVHRLGKPWGECSKDGDVFPNNYTGSPYSQVECERHCVNLEVYRRCKCYHPRFMPATLFPLRGLVCQTNSTSWEDRCFISVVEDTDDGEIQCSCPPACMEHHYDVTSSSSQLNPDFFRILKKAKSLFTNDGVATVSDSDREFSLMGVQIFYNNFFVTHINETAIYSWESLIANIGGNMGLFLGLSLVTILEVLEFFTEMIARFIKRKKYPHRNKTIVINF